MIPAKIAKKLLREYASQFDGTEPLSEDYEEVITKTLATSALVLRGAKNAEQKARRYLTEGRLTVHRVDAQTGLVVASCTGAEGVYKLGHDPAKNEWRCTCPAPRKCSHLIALKLVVRL